MGAGSIAGRRRPPEAPEPEQPTVAAQPEAEVGSRVEVMAAFKTYVGKYDDNAQMEVGDLGVIAEVKGPSKDIVVNFDFDPYVQIYVCGHERTKMRVLTEADPKYKAPPKPYEDSPREGVAVEVVAPACIGDVDLVVGEYGKITHSFEGAMNVQLDRGPKLILDNRQKGFFRTLKRRTEQDPGKLEASVGTRVEVMEDFKVLHVKKYNDSAYLKVGDLGVITEVKVPGEEVLVKFDFDPYVQMYIVSNHFKKMRVLTEADPTYTTPPKPCEELPREGGIVEAVEPANICGTDLIIGEYGKITCVNSETFQGAMDVELDRGPKLKLNRRQKGLFRTVLERR